MKAMNFLMGVVVLIALNGMAMADPTGTLSGTTVINAQIGEYIKVTAPNNIDTWALTPGADNQLPISPEVDSNINWALTMKTPQTNGDNFDGKFYSDDAHTSLAGFLNLAVGSAPASPLDGNNPASLGTGSSGTHAVGITLHQPVEFTDPVSSYRISLEFDATAN